MPVQFNSKGRSAKSRSGKTLLPDPLKPQLLQQSRRRRHINDHVWEAERHAPEPRNDLQPEFEVVDIALGDLKSPKRQLRTLDASDIAEMKNSFQQFGVSGLITIGRDNRVINGVAMVEAARELGITTLKAIRLTHLNEAQEQALRIGLNRHGQTREWLSSELKQEFEELLGIGQPIDNLGFSKTLIDQILLEPPKSLPPEAGVDADAKPVTLPGDLWHLGDHVLLCGDAKDAGAYDRLLRGASVQLALTDPPYAVAVEKVVSTQHRDFVEGGGDMTHEEFEQLIAASFGHIGDALVEGGMLYSFMDWKHAADLIGIGKALGYEHMNLVTWVKGQGGMGSLYRSQSEFVVVLKKPGQHKNNIMLGKNGRDRTNVWHYAGAGTIGTDARAMLKEHPTPKPVTMLVDALLDVTDRDDIVLDPFGGSGSTLIACEETDRIARVIELDPLYCDLIIRRWQEATKQRAVLDESNETFDIIAERRLGTGDAEAGDGEE